MWVYQGCSPSLDPIDHLRRVRECLAEGDDLFLALKCIDENEVSAGVAVARDALDRPVEPLIRSCVGARDEDELGRATRVNRGTNLLDHLLLRDHLLAAHVTAAFRYRLVLDMERCDAGGG